MQHHMPHYVNWTRPRGGFCSWLTLSSQRGLPNLYERALQAGWIFAPGDVFLAEPSGEEHLRICFGNQPPATIRNGVEVLSRLIRETVGADARPVREPLDSTPLV
jgi:2-aminoadipate transaminase